MSPCAAHVHEILPAGRDRESARADPVLCRRQAFVLVDDTQRLVGIITRGEVLRAFDVPENRVKSAAHFAETEVVTIHPDATLQSAITTLLRHDVGRLIVVDRSDPRRVVGYLGRGDILAAQRRRDEEEQHRQRGRLLAPRLEPTAPPAPS